MSENYDSIMRNFCKIDDLSTKISIISNLMEAANHNMKIDAKTLIYCLLYSNEPVIENKLISLMSLLCVKSTTFKSQLSSTSVIYHYILRQLTSGQLATVTRTLYLLTSLCCVLEEREHMEADSSSSSGRAQQMARETGCLRKLCLLFLQVDQNNSIRPQLCNCLTECCSGSVENQNHSSHILPKCLKELTEWDKAQGTEIICLVTELIRDNSNNCSKFTKQGGIQAISSNLLNTFEGVELLYTVLDTSRSAQAKARQLNVFQTLRQNLEKMRETGGCQDLKLLHWTSHVILKFNKNNTSIQGSSSSNEKQKKIRDATTDTQKNNGRPKELTQPLRKAGQAKKNSGRIEKTKIDNKKYVFSNSIRSKFDAICSPNVSINSSYQSFRNTIKSNKIRSQKINTENKENENTQEINKSTSRLSTIFNPKSHSTPMKPTFRNYNSNKNIRKHNDENFRETPVNFVLPTNYDASEKVKKFVEQVMQNCKDGNVNRIGENYVCFVNMDSNNSQDDTTVILDSDAMEYYDEFDFDDFNTYTENINMDDDLEHNPYEYDNNEVNNIIGFENNTTESDSDNLENLNSKTRIVNDYFRVGRNLLEINKCEGKLQKYHSIRGSKVQRDKMNVNRSSTKYNTGVKKDNIKVNRDKMNIDNGVQRDKINVDSETSLNKHKFSIEINKCEGKLQKYHSIRGSKVQRDKMNVNRSSTKYNTGVKKDNIKVNRDKMNIDNGVQRDKINVDSETSLNKHKFSIEYLIKGVPNVIDTEVQKDNDMINQRDKCMKEVHKDNFTIESLVQKDNIIFNDNVKKDKINEGIEVQKDNEVFWKDNLVDSEVQNEKFKNNTEVQKDLDPNVKRDNEKVNKVKVDLMKKFDSNDKTVNDYEDLLYKTLNSNENDAELNKSTFVISIGRQFSEINICVDEFDIENHTTNEVCKEKNILGVRVNERINFSDPLNIQTKDEHKQFFRLNDIIDNISNMGKMDQLINISKDVFHSNDNIESWTDEEISDDSYESIVSSKNCCKRKCEELEKLIRMLKRGISRFGLNFHIIAKTFWPQDSSIKPDYLKEVYFTYIVKK